MYGKALNKGFTQGFDQLRQYIRKHFRPHTYQFHSIVPADTNKFFYVPRQQWQIENRIMTRLSFTLYFGLFLVGFFLADVTYAIAYNPKQSYRLHIMYPKAVKFVDDLLQGETTKPWVDIAKGFWVKDKVEFRSFWQKVYSQLRDKQQKEKARIHDEKVVQLKQEMEEFDKKYPAVQKADRESFTRFHLPCTQYYSVSFQLSIINSNSLALRFYSMGCVQTLTKVKTCNDNYMATEIANAKMSGLNASNQGQDPNQMHHFSNKATIIKRGSIDRVQSNHNLTSMQSFPESTHSIYNSASEFENRRKHQNETNIKNNSKKPSLNEKQHRKSGDVVRYEQGKQNYSAYDSYGFNFTQPEKQSQVTTFSQKKIELYKRQTPLPIVEESSQEYIDSNVIKKGNTNIRNEQMVARPRRFLL